MAKFKSRSPQRIFKRCVFFLSRTLIVCKKLFPRRSLVLHRGRLAVDFRRNTTVSSISHHLAWHVIGCRWGELVRSLWTWTLGVKIKQYFKALFVSLSFLSLLSQSKRGKSDELCLRRAEPPPETPSHFDLLTSTSGMALHPTPW